MCAQASAPANTPVYQAHAHGQSIWLDNISRDLLLSGELRRWVAAEGIRGVTSNPAIFEKAIAKSSDYDAAARALVAQGAKDALDIFERLAVVDIQLGCDVLRPVFEASGGRDGFVSLEVSPHLANDTAGTIAEAHRLAKAVSRDNLMIKVPATPAGIPAIRQLIADGQSMNVTLLFAVVRLSGRPRRVHVGPRGSTRPGSVGLGDRERRELLRVAHRRERRAARREGARRLALGSEQEASPGPQRQGRDRQRKGRLRPLPRGPRGRALAEALGGGCGSAARALGEHGHQGSRRCRRPSTSTS